MTRVIFDCPADLEGRQPPRRTRLRDPVEVVVATRVEEVRPAIARIEEGVRAGLHAAGWIAYEAAPAFDAAMRVRPPGRLPLVWFGLFPPDRVERVGPLEGSGGRAAGPAPEGPVSSPDWRLPLTERAHAAAVRAIHAAIAAGRTYQVNHTTRMSASWDGDAGALYEQLRRAQGGGYNAFLDTGRHAVLSASPELFFRTRGRRILTRPMKGTRPRGRWWEEDRRLRAELEASAKDRAENLMIVDLLRNDLGRICETGSVRVPALHATERYRTVWQMTSTVEGTLRPDVGLDPLLTALFPCGSVTGAPKISTMNEIARLEATPREVYCGAIGWLRPDGERLFTVPIRTAWLDRERAELRYGTGGGVVWDSDPREEYHELRAKAVVARETWPSFSLLETLGLHEGRYLHHSLHLRRLTRSAEYFGFSDPTPAAADALASAARAHPRGHHLVRLVVDPDGRARTETRPLHRVGHLQTTPPPHTDQTGTAAEVVLAGRAVDSADRFLYHKTTHRIVYDRHRACLEDSDFDVLLHNERGEVTEFTRGNVVVALDGTLVTPPIHSGLLPGCLRQQLLADGVVQERVVRTDELTRATGLWFINSARGWIRVTLRHGPGTEGRVRAAARGE